MFIEGMLPVTRGRLATISHDAPLIDAARLLSKTQISLVIVCNADTTLAGVITKTDVVKQIGRCVGSSCTTAASAVMTRDVTVCHPGDLLSAAWSTMKEQGLKHLPVVDAASHPMGVLYARDALQVLLVQTEYEELLLRDYVMGIGYR